MTSAGIRPVDSDKAATTAGNPALSSDERLATETAKRKRIPMSTQRAKLSTPEIVGFHLHWINDDGSRIAQAIEGGYAFVTPDETSVTSVNLSGEPIGHGSDMGTRVSVVVGKHEGGAPMRAYLMKIVNEYYEEDQNAVQDRVDNLHKAMNQGKQDIDGVEDSAKEKALRYATSSRKSTYARRKAA